MSMVGGDEDDTHAQVLVDLLCPPFRGPNPLKEPVSGGMVNQACQGQRTQMTPPNGTCSITTLDHKTVPSSGLKNETR